jgi:hypothetical protein
MRCESVGALLQFIGARHSGVPTIDRIFHHGSQNRLQAMQTLKEFATEFAIFNSATSSKADAKGCLAGKIQLRLNP